MEDGEFDEASSGALQCEPVQCGQLKKNGYVVLNDRPCRIVDLTTSKPGKHGSAKVNITSIDIFTNRKYEANWPSSHSLMKPVVQRKEYDLSDISDGYLSLLCADGTMKEDIRLPDDTQLKEKIQSIWEGQSSSENVVISVLSAMGEEQCVAVKTVQEKA